jgi:hypothetical protein
LLLEPRSVLVLSDAARYDWEHGIAPRKTDEWHGQRLARQRRLSVTFRFADSRHGGPSPGAGERQRRSRIVSP